jgi:hypothetical protein
MHDFHILRDGRRRGGGIADNLRILRCRDLAPLLEDRNMRGTAREEPSAQCSKEETQKTHSTITCCLTTAAKQGRQLYFKSAMCGNPSDKTSYEICARANAQYIRARMRLWQLNTLTFWLFMRRSFVQTAKKHGDFNC